MFECTECSNGYATLRGLQLHRRSHALRVIHAVATPSLSLPDSLDAEEGFGGHDEYDFSSFLSGVDSEPDDGGVDEATEVNESGDRSGAELDASEPPGDLVSVTFGPEVRSTTPPPLTAPASDNPCFPFQNPEQHYWAQWASQYNLPATCIDDMCKLQDLRSEGRVFESSKALRKSVDAIPQDVPLRYTTVDVVVTWTRAEREKLGRSGQSKKGAKSSGVPACFDNVTSKFSFIPLRTVVRNLASNATFAAETDWTSRHIVNADGHKVLSEPRDGSVWKKLEATIPTGETLAHGIIACDKVSRGGFASRKKGYPVYFSLGNIKSEVRNKITSGAMIKVGSLPVFEDGKFAPSLALALPRPMTLIRFGAISVIKEVKDHPLFPVFYAKVIFACFKSIFDGYAFHDVHEVLAPDTLHQVKLGFHADILGNVETEILALPFGADLWNEVQRRFLLQFPFPGLLFFARATAFANWTGDQCSQCIKIFPGIIAGLGLPAATTSIVKAYVEIFMLSRFRRHTNHIPGESSRSNSIPTTLDRLELAHQTFLESVDDGFANARPLGIGNLRRVHGWGHLKLGVERHASLKGVSTEAPERLHQTAEKLPYNSSSKKRTAESEILIRNEDKQALQTLRQRVEAAGVPSLDEMARTAQPGRRRRRGKVVVDVDAGVRTGSDDYRNDAVLTGTPAEIALALCQPHLTTTISDFVRSSPIFRNNRKIFANPSFKIRTYGLFYTSFVRPDPTRDPTYAPEIIQSCIRARPTWNYSDLDGMIGPRYDFVCIKTEISGVVRHRIARVKVIFRFHSPTFDSPFLLVEWLSLTSTTPNPETGWLKYSKTDKSEIIVASTVISNVTLQPVFARESFMNRLDLFEQHNEFFLMKGVTDELYDYF
ncbi:hypothetical protein P7C70_g8272, partial [Phenoliferia sp. Uapishka_3]